jgi:hypothetical protein
MRLSVTFRSLGWMLLFHLQGMPIPKAPTVGLSLRIPHTTDFVVGMDFDNIKDERLIDELQYLQELFGLGDFHVFVTSEFGRHVICIDRLALKEALEVIYASTCDDLFKRGVKINEFRTWVLRTQGKGNRPAPKYLYSVESPYNSQRLQSQAHAIFLQKYFGAKIRLVNPDENTVLNFQDFRTGSKLGGKQT